MTVQTGPNAALAFGGGVAAGWFAVSRMALLGGGTSVLHDTVIGLVLGLIGATCFRLGQRWTGALAPLPPLVVGGMVAAALWLVAATVSDSVLLMLALFCPIACLAPTVLQLALPTWTRPARR